MVTGKKGEFTILNTIKSHTKKTMRSRTHTKLKEQKKDFIKSLFTPIGCGYEQKYCDCDTQKSLDRSFELILVKIKFQIVARFSIHYKFRAFVHIVLQCALDIHIT